MRTVRSSLRRRGLPAADVEDLVQETCVAILLKGTFWQMPQTDRERYAVRMALGFRLNESRASIRRLRRETLASEGAALWEECFEEEVQRAELRAQVYVAMLRLPDELFSLAVARFVREETVEQIAARLGLASGTVKSRIRRTRRELERELSTESTRAELTIALRSLTAPDDASRLIKPIAKARARLDELTHPDDTERRSRATTAKADPGADIASVTGVVVARQTFRRGVRE